eukprot:3357031-Alexandrium_andersonii.AAC.1
MAPSGAPAPSQPQLLANLAADDASVASVRNEGSEYGDGEYVGSGLGARASLLDDNDCANLADFDVCLPVVEDLTPFVVGHAV